MIDFSRSPISIRVTGYQLETGQKCQHKTSEVLKTSEVSTRHPQIKNQEKTSTFSQEIIMKNRCKTISLLMLCLSLPQLSYAEQTLFAIATETAPKIDGIADDPVWSKAQAVTTFDKIGDLNITLKSVYKNETIYMLVQYPDKESNYTHKTLRWNAETKVYETGGDREDAFVFKWNMEPYPLDLSVTAENPYRADVWFWKAHRTDHAGYADDKIQIYSRQPQPHSSKILNKKGQPFYLTRLGDSGSGAYKKRIVTEYQEDQVGKFDFLEPTGSRADIRAKGHWKDGIWTIEFARALYTDAVDDVQFMQGGRYQFGVSRYEIAGRKPNPELEQPLYGSGDVNETLFLEIK